MKKAIFSAIMLLGSSAAAQSYNDHHSGWGMHDYYSPGSFLMSLLLIVLVGVVLYFVIRQTNVGRSVSKEDTPLDILKKRYARGEISKDEYDRMKNDLS